MRKWHLQGVLKRMQLSARVLVRPSQSPGFHCQYCKELRLGYTRVIPTPGIGGGKGSRSKSPMATSRVQSYPGLRETMKKQIYTRTHINYGTNVK